MAGITASANRSAQADLQRMAKAATPMLDVKRLRILPVDPVPHPPQPREVAQLLLSDGPAGHLCIVSTRRTAIVPHCGWSRGSRLPRVRGRSYCGGPDWAAWPAAP